MAGKYAAGTDVPVSRSRDEIERTLARFGASAFGYMTSQDGTVAISFEFKSLRVLMKMQLPSREEFRYTGTTTKRRTDSAVERDWEQACRQRWRSLANGVKAKLALVDDGISTIEREFLSDIVLPGGGTLGDAMVPQIEAMSRGEVRPQLPEITGSIE